MEENILCPAHLPQISAQRFHDPEIDVPHLLLIVTIASVSLYLRDFLVFKEFVHLFLYRPKGAQFRQRKEYVGEITMDPKRRRPCLPAARLSQLWVC